MQIATRKKAPEWARQKIIETAAHHCQSVDTIMMARGLPSLYAAVCGAMLLAQASRRHYSPCDDEDCDDCKKLRRPDVSEEVRRQAHAMLDFYLQVGFTVATEAEGSA